MSAVYSPVGTTDESPSTAFVSSDCRALNHHGRSRKWRPSAALSFAPSVRVRVHAHVHADPRARTQPAPRAHTQPSLGHASHHTLAHSSHEEQSLLPPPQQDLRRHTPRLRQPPLPGRRNIPHKLRLVRCERDGARQMNEHEGRLVKLDSAAEQAFVQDLI